MSPSRLRRVARGFSFAALFVLLLGFWMRETRVVEDCRSGACQELLVSDASAGTAMFVAAAILWGAALALWAWQSRKPEAELDRASTE